jgi:hypothetical protein
MRTTIPVTAVHRCNGYLSLAAKALLALLTGTEHPSARPQAGKRGVTLLRRAYGQSSEGAKADR